MALKSFRKFVDKAEGTFRRSAAQFHKRFSVQLGGEIARLTPVRTGRATANWKASIGSPNLTPVKDYDRSATAFRTVSQMVADLTSIKFGDTVYISNAVQGEDKTGFTGEGYIIGLEEGKSPQAPNGMVLIALARAKDIAREAKKTKP